MFFKDLNTAEGVLNLEYQFYSGKNYYTDSKVMRIHKQEKEKRLQYVIKQCNVKDPSLRELYLLALAYNRMGALYTDYAIYYLEKYLSYGKYYTVKYKFNQSLEDSISTQWNILYYALATKYYDNLDYENALTNTLKSKVKPSCMVRDPYGLISNCLYRLGDIDSAISNLRQAISLSSDTYLIESYKIQLNKLLEYKENGKTFKISAREVLRKDINTGAIYNLKTGEIK